MRLKFQIAFFLILISYLAVLFSGSYVSVYYTYFALPTLPFLGMLAFGNIRRIHGTAKMIFYFSIVLTVITVATVSYVGVYVPSIVAVVLVLSGGMMLLTKEKKI